MKQGKLSVCLVLVSLLLLLPAICQQQSVTSYDSVMLDDFDTSGTDGWQWHAQGSNFSAEGFPKVQYFEGSPNSVKHFLEKEGVVGKVLGVEASFNRKGDNWFEIFPAVQDANGKYIPHNLPLDGKVDHLDMWVWGAGYSYDLDLLVRDADGRVHALGMGKLSFTGWRNIKVYIPSWFVQRSRFRSGSKNMYFVGFRVRTDPQAPVDRFTVYFDRMKYLTNTFAHAFDGYELDSVVFDGGDGK